MGNLYLEVEKQMWSVIIFQKIKRYILTKLPNLLVDAMNNQMVL